MASPYQIDKEIYKQWLEKKVQTLEEILKDSGESEEGFEKAVSTIENRIKEIASIEFYAKQEARLVYEYRDKMLGRKGISPITRTMRERLITEPDIKVEFQEPRPVKEKKKTKKNLVMDMLGLDMSELAAAVKNKKANKEDDKALLSNWTPPETIAPVEEKPKASQEEIKAKADALKERIRLAKEKAASKVG